MRSNSEKNSAVLAAQQLDEPNGKIFTVGFIYPLGKLRLQFSAFLKIRHGLL